MLDPKRNPCNECPFRRKSLPGYVGEASVESFAATASCGEIPMPCHKEVDYTAENWKELQEAAHSCTGHAIYLSNSMKSPRNPNVATLPENHDKILSNQFEFLDHHGGDPVEFTKKMLPPGVTITKEYAKQIRAYSKKRLAAAKK